MQRFALLDEHGIVLATVVYHTTIPMTPDHSPHKRIGLMDNAPIGYPLGTPVVVHSAPLPAPEPMEMAKEHLVPPPAPQVVTEIPTQKKRWWRRA
jgi:hypothetical protein